MKRTRSELRWNPILEEWVAIATHRQNRPQMPENYCPFCPGSGKVPDDYNVYIYPNDFPTFSLSSPKPENRRPNLYKVKKSVGVCDVVLYHPDHLMTLADMEIPRIVELIGLWSMRFQKLGEREEIKYVFIFENKGDVIGVTMPHPHGQIYAFPYIPPVIERELKSAKGYVKRKPNCLFCDILNEEKREGKRKIVENRSFFAFIPFFARYPYEVHIMSKNHVLTLLDFSENMIEDFAHILKIVLQKYDNLFGFSFPYMMVMHQAPTDGKDYSFYHFHVEFYPPYRSREKLKYLAGCEMGAGTFINDTLPEERAQELREISIRSDGS
ncbi:MAG: galactose-1-phosphate uridylyltransferase [Gemmatimonadota bacterium]|nr:MAG: galactose-1-phosphate uridylyltransferase [Gemmatimonadota bacterium]